VSIAQQIATPTPVARTRAPAAPLTPAPIARPAYALVRIAGLVALTALGTALIAGTIFIAIMVLAANLGG
jgi:NAD/NADP transhydrogenase alpha subunit